MTVARLVGLTTKACCGGKDGSVESTTTSGIKLKRKASSQRRGNPLCSTGIFCFFGRERKFVLRLRLMVEVLLERKFWVFI